MVFCQHFLLFDWDKFLEKTDIIKEKAEKKKILEKFLLSFWFTVIITQILKSAICCTGSYTGDVLSASACLIHSFNCLSIYLSFSVRRDDIVVKQDC